METTPTGGSPNFTTTTIERERLKYLAEYLEPSRDLDPENISACADILSETKPSEGTRFAISRDLRRVAYALRLLRGDFDEPAKGGK